MSVGIEAQEIASKSFVAGTLCGYIIGNNANLGRQVCPKETILQSPVDEVWIKGRFDGDYSAIPGMIQHAQADSETTRVHFTRGRLTAIERVSGPPPVGTLSLRQEVLDAAHLTAPDGQAWIAPLQDLHIVDWESDSTASILGGGGPRVGRLVGWVYARVSDPRQSSRKKPINHNDQWPVIRLPIKRRLSPHRATAYLPDLMARGHPNTAIQ